MRIYKYELNVTDCQALDLPTGAKILTVQMQRNICCLWALVDETAPYLEARHIRIYGTGHPVSELPGAYISTVMLNDGELVFHAFEE